MIDSWCPTMPIAMFFRQYFHKWRGKIFLSPPVLARAQDKGRLHDRYKTFTTLFQGLVTSAGSPVMAHFVHNQMQFYGSIVF